MMSEEKTVVSRTAPIATLSWFEGEMRVVIEHEQNRRTECPLFR